MLPPVLVWLGTSIGLHQLIHQWSATVTTPSLSPSPSPVSVSTPRVIAVTRVHCLLSNRFPEKQRVVDFIHNNCKHSSNFSNSNNNSDNNNNNNNDNPTSASVTASAAATADRVLICAGANTLEQLIELKNYLEGIIQELCVSDCVAVLPVFPWGYFTNSLNHAIIYAQDHHFSHILFQVINYSIFVLLSLIEIS